MPTLRCKLVVIGDPGVGKTALVQMFHSDGAHYPKNYVMTVGTDFCVKVVNIPDTNAVVELYIFDNAGQSFYQELVQQYWEGTSMVALVFDVTKPETFEDCEKWIRLIREKLPERELPGVLIGNKVELRDESCITTEKAREFAGNWGLEYFECSAAKGLDVDIPFHFVAATFHRLYLEKTEAISRLTV
eukprot:TRINITY_DN7579_c0_g2_i1.p1 TRINITY_DN7579_c0_g2~~TRINITY_DN7579_c0_g2_i1.p1  ORF type:complete len:188 (+),score=48.80 TRINITY_DN7579_c0_g2_i1:64-627(+)